MLSDVQGRGERKFSGSARAERRGRGADRQACGTQAGAAPRSNALSGREIGVLEELAMGTSTEEIAAKFHVSPHTVRTHIKNGMRKLEAHTRAHAVAIALSEGAIEFESDA